MPTDELLMEANGHVTTITLNRPQKLNAITPAMAEALAQAVEACNADDQVRVVIVTGAGPKAFCAGSDIKELDAYGSPWEFRNRPDYCDALRRLRKPVLGLINGYCLGGGLELAMACDLRIASDNATLGAPEIKLGWVGGGGMAFTLAHAIGSSNAALMLFTGDQIQAAQAKTWGLVTEVVSREELLPRGTEIAATIAQRAPIAAQTAKANLQAAFTMTREDAIRYERDLQTICLATEDAREGRAAFKEKRPALFKGR